MNPTHRLALITAGGVIGGATAGVFFAMFARGHWLTLGYPLLVAGLTGGIFTVARGSFKDKKPAEQTLYSLMISLLLGPLLSLAASPFLLNYVYANSSQRPSGLVGTMAGLGFVLGLVVGVVNFVGESGRAHTQKVAMGKVEDSLRLRKDQNLKDAEEKLREALLELELAFGSLHPDTARTVTEIGNFFAATGEPEKAAAMYKRALGVYESTLGAQHPLVADCLLAMGQMELKSSPDTALLLLRRAQSIREAELGPHALPVGMTLFEVSNALGQKERWVEAEQAARKALGIVEKGVGGAHPDYLHIAGRLASYNVKLSKYTEAEKVLQKVMTEREKAGLPEDGELVNLLVEMGRVLSAQNRAKEAEKSYLRALNVLRRSVGPDHPLRAEILEACKPRMVDAEGAPPGYDAAITALLSSDLGVWRKAVEAHPEVLNMADGTGWVPLQWAVFLTLDRVLDTLIFANVEVMPSEGSGMPPLLIAARWGNRKMMQTLLNKGADINQRDSNGWTAMHCVAASGDERTVEALVQKNADLSLTDRDGYTPLHVACLYDATRVAVELIGRGAKIDVQAPPSMSTALHVSAAKGNRAVAECLIFNGADLSLRDSNKRTATEVAAATGNHEMARFLSQQQQQISKFEAQEQKAAAKASASGKQKTAPVPEESSNG